MSRASLLAAIATLTACFERPTGPSCVGDACADVRPDALDEGPLDDALDAAAETGQDAGAEVADAAPEPAEEAAVDVALDVAQDAPLDLGPDAAPDAALDTPVDTARDASLDAALDATFDAALDRADVFDATRDAPLDVREVGVDAREVGVDAREVGVDAPPSGGCISGAVGTHVARFRWTGTTSGSRASVSYEANTLPDRTRWRATANSRSIGYTPVFGDPFLGEGGLELSGTVFIDVELSTAGLGSLSNVTLAVYGRSYNTTASGSFAWRTFTATGATPSGFVSNVAPYRWYRADATAAFVPGDNGVLLRITPGPPSGSLVVSRVELCFNAR